MVASPEALGHPTGPTAGYVSIPLFTMDSADAGNTAGTATISLDTYALGLATVVFNSVSNSTATGLAPMVPTLGFSLISTAGSNASGSVTVSMMNQFSEESKPTLLGVSPTSTASPGTQPLTITGDFLNGATSVTFTPASGGQSTVVTTGITSTPTKSIVAAPKAVLTRCSSLHRQCPPRLWSNSAATPPDHGDCTDRASPGQVSPDHSAPADNQNTLFVQQVFNDILHRAPDSASLTYLTNLLNTNAVTPQQVVYAIQTSQEARIDQVAAVFQAVLNRQPSSQESSAGVAFLTAGGSLSTFKAQIISSQEFFNDQGGTNAAWITAVYKQATGSSAVSASTISTVSNELNSGVSRGAIALGVFNNQAAATFEVQTLFETFLARTPSATDPSIQSLVSALMNGISEDLVVATHRCSLSRSSSTSCRKRPQDWRRVLISLRGGSGKSLSRSGDYIREETLGQLIIVGRAWRAARLRRHRRS